MAIDLDVHGVALVVAALVPQAHHSDLMAAMISGITALLAHSMFDNTMDHGTIDHGAIVGPLCHGSKRTFLAQTVTFTLPNIYILSNVRCNPLHHG